MKRTQKVIYALGWLLLQRAIWGRVLSDHSPQPATQPLVAFTTPPPPFLPQLVASLNCGVNKIKREQRNSSGLFSNSFGLREALKRQQEVRPSCRERGIGQGRAGQTQPQNGRAMENFSSSSSSGNGSIATIKSGTRVIETIGHCYLARRFNLCH